MRTRREQAIIRRQLREIRELRDRLRVSNLLLLEYMSHRDAGGSLIRKINDQLRS